MRAQRVLAIGLDGYEESVERLMIARGELPALARLRSGSARFLLDHGPAQRTGLAWEHVSSGLSPEAARRWAAVHFDPGTYSVWQEGTRLQPFPARLRSRTVVFDAAYFDLKQAPKVCGLVGWGAHDPGVPLTAQPAGLLEAFTARFGSYPATEWIYGHAWPSAERARRMGEGLAYAVEIRARAARWLLSERLPEWDLALVAVSEPHSAIEGLWHGVDASHPLHPLPSAAPARDGLYAVYRAVDRLVGELADAFPDAAVVVFSMGGMGPNRSDVPSMVLLSELMYRHSFARPYLRQPASWTAVSGAGPELGVEDNWASAVNRHIAAPPLARRLAARVSGRVKRILGNSGIGRSPARGATEVSFITWMPAKRYLHHWRSMRAFALPSYYDGRIRINLAGRERNGVVPAAQYETACDEIEAVVRECTDPATGEGVVDHIDRAHRIQDRDPLRLGATESDLCIVWKGCACAWDHPRYGRIGPAPFRRPGGHTGAWGMAYVRGNGVEPGDRGVRSSFDVVPTVIEMLGEAMPSGLSGSSLLAPSDSSTSPGPVAARTA
jgi:predicted AlkP superfamily phosphohydrolase/phosphomutase